MNGLAIWLLGLEIWRGAKLWDGRANAGPTDGERICAGDMLKLRPAFPPKLRPTFPLNDGARPAPPKFPTEWPTAPLPAKAEPLAARPAIRTAAAIADIDLMVCLTFWSQ